MFDQVKPEIVLPEIDAFAANEFGNTGDCGRLPNEELRLVGDSGGSEVRVPIHAGRFGVKVGPLPRIVLLEDVSGISVRGERLPDPNLKRQNTRTFALGASDAG